MKFDRITGVAVLLLAWEILAVSRFVPVLYFPAPPSVAVAGWDLLRSTGFVSQLGMTCLRMASGLAIATAVGLAMALATARYRMLFHMLEPAVNMLRVLPPPAIVPLSIFAFGIGAPLFLFIVAFAAVWPIYINAASALGAIEPVLFVTGRSFGYSSWEILLRLRLPAAMPEIVTGFRLGAGTALLATVAAEMLAGQSGLGFMLYDAAFTLRTRDMFAIMAIIGVLGLALNGLIAQGSRLIVGWHLTMSGTGESG